MQRPSGQSGQGGGSNSGASNPPATGYSSHHQWVDDQHHAAFQQQHDFWSQQAYEQPYYGNAYPNFNQQGWQPGYPPFQSQGFNFQQPPPPPPSQPPPPGLGDVVRRDRASGPRSKEAVRAIPLPSNPAPRAQAVRDAPRAQASRDDHSHSESEPSSDSENSQADAEEDPAEDAPRDPAVDAPNAEPNSFGTSFAESVRLLGLYRPSAVKEAPTKESFLTAADEICGTSASKSSSDPTFLLKES